MQLLKEIGEKKDIKYKRRTAARAVVFNKKGDIALLFASKDNYHKLPGGGVESHESIEETLSREILEETGCEIEVNEEVGKVIEYRNKINLKQTSFCFLANFKKILSKPNFTEEEKAKGFQLVWMNFDKAIKIIEKEKPKDYHLKFMRERDLCFVKKANEIITSSQPH